MAESVSIRTGSQKAITPIQLIAEFEVVGQFSTHPDYWVDKSVHWIERNIPGIEYRQIARLVVDFCTTVSTLVLFSL